MEKRRVGEDVMRGVGNKKKQQSSAVGAAAMPTLSGCYVVLFLFGISVACWLDNRLGA